MTNRCDSRYWFYVHPVQIHAELAALGEQNAGMSGKKFWGWYTITAENVEQVGCRVFPTPLDGSPYHADIVMPVALGTKVRRDAIREYAIGLAYCTEFLPWGEWTQEVT
ncbi:MAG: hypothetical protein OXC63_14705 [Aestuariivita sp.]|nr:hypothetical protein [Aestuariivita sp.]MCY4289827.1 hypothetical protein [Aestuariivita sp.]MCY4345636.1 hypothetical protein [Aestuariivita sp.]